MSPLSELLKTVAGTTLQAAGVGLASTTASCYLACQIEGSAHRLIYHYFPHKYANVEYANGLTQDQLGTARNMTSVTQSGQEENFLSSGSSFVFDRISGTSDESSLESKFWKEEHPTLSLMREVFMMPSQEIIACSMTG
jgi:hypothetical protein